MAFIPVPNCVHAILEYGASPQFWTNTLWFEKDGFVYADMVTLAPLVFDWMGTGIMPQLHVQWYSQKVTLYDMNSETAPYVAYAGTPVAGSRTGLPGAISVAAVVTLRSAGRGRSARGRNYITGFSEPDIGTEQITNAAIITGLETAYTDLRAIVSTAGWQLVVVQRSSDGVPLTQGVPRAVVSSEIRNSIFGQQTRRVPRP